MNPPCASAPEISEGTNQDQGQEWQWCRNYREWPAGVVAFVQKVAVSETAHSLHKVLFLPDFEALHGLHYKWVVSDVTLVGTFSRKNECFGRYYVALPTWAFIKPKSLEKD